MIFSPVTGVTGVTASLHEVACPDVDLLLTDSEPEPYVAPSAPVFHTASSTNRHRNPRIGTTDPVSGQASFKPFHV